MHQVTLAEPKVEPVHDQKTLKSGPSQITSLSIILANLSQFFSILSDLKC
jgi:hypothetical protein